jgi:Salmonella virulence plasmid 65kDa B protein
MGRGFSGNAFARHVFGLALAAGLWAAGPAGAADPAPGPAGLGNGAPALGNGQKSATAAAPEAKNPAPDAAKQPAAEKTTAESPGGAGEKKISEPKADSAKAAAKAAAAPNAPAAAAASAAPADAGTGASSQVLAPNIPTFGADGALRYSYGLDLPAFRGLEPEIALNYDSGRKTKLGAGYQGWLGFGWGLDGFDMIERQRPKGGVPAFDSSDVYLLNGSELVPCVAGMDSPSCAAGGNYATEVESYQRIRYDSAGGAWTVTQRDGTRLVFYPMSSFATAALGDANVAYSSKWVLSYVVDTHSNWVIYDYDCTDGTVCYPKTVTYGLYQVKFNLEDRPDHILMANGRTISRTAKRIRSIGVTAKGVNVSAYRLFYDQAPASNNSRLTYVYRYGSDVALDAAGAVTGGSSLPPVTFQYRDFNAAGTGYSTAYASWESTVSSPCTDAATASDVSVRSGRSAADGVGLVVSALDSGHYGVLCGAACEAALV